MNEPISIVELSLPFLDYNLKLDRHIFKIEICSISSDAGNIFKNTHSYFNKANS